MANALFGRLNPKMTSKSLRRLRFTIGVSSSALGGNGKKRRGRPPNLKPLLVAMDDICRRGICDQPDKSRFGLPATLKLGRHSKRQSGLSPYPVWISRLAERWSITEATARDYIYDSERFYYPLANGTIKSLLELPLEPRLEIADIQRAIDELRRRIPPEALVELAKGGLIFDLLPVIRKTKQPNAAQ